MSKMAEDHKYLDFSGRNIRAGSETLKRFVKGISRDEMKGFELDKASTSDRYREDG